jgi:hypothetical protein
MSKKEEGKTYCIEYGEQADVEVELPPGEVSLGNHGDSKRLHHAEDALHCRHKDLIRTLLEHRSLHKDP